ncbi:multidrug effflux MFS transporter [Tolumonas lignilytica]|jgi:Arabinose efflux permease|uniref:multidrug effflux MFS transporter n=1 Tax=Tolumonas lignilytica TaxID=1283284 RepID=UPI0004BA3CFB|nr:multidrug effflux MFS transporter [Tolumonas lignilytica]
MSSDSSSGAYYKDSVVIQQPSIVQSKELSRREKWIPVIYSCLLIAVGQTGMSLLLPALPEMHQDLHISSQMTQWLVSAYLLGFGPSQLFYGPFSDIYGRRPVLLSGLMVAVVGILLSLFAHQSAAIIILGRVLQGVGAGCASVIARVSLRDRYEGTHLRQAMAYFGIVMAFVPTITPLAGGFLTTHFGWVSIFFTMAGYLGLLWVLLFYRFEETHTAESSADRAHASDFVHQYWQLLKSDHFRCYSGVVWIQYSLNVFSISVMPFIMQMQVGMSADVYGRWTLLPAISLVLGGVLASKTRHYFSKESVLQGASMLQLVSGVCMLILPHTALLMMLSLSLFAFGNGMAFPNALSSLLEPYKRTAGTATALAGAGQMLSASFASAFLVSLGITSIMGLGAVLLLGGVVLLYLTHHARNTVPACDDWHSHHHPIHH